MGVFDLYGEGWVEACEAQAGWPLARGNELEQAGAVLLLQLLHHRPEALHERTHPQDNKRKCRANAMQIKCNGAWTRMWMYFWGCLCMRVGSFVFVRVGYVLCGEGPNTRHTGPLSARDRQTHPSNHYPPVYPLTHRPNYPSTNPPTHQPIYKPIRLPIHPPSNRP